MALLLIVIAIIILYIVMITPSGQGRAERWRGTPFAHRGLHGGDIAENSCEAFEAACAKGYGIELDVQLSADGTVVVFHDDTLARMTGDARRVDSVPLEELKALSLRGKGVVPTFEEVLCLVNGRVPLLVELKNGRRNAELCRKVRDMLRAYKGAYIVESFNPLIVDWMRANAPEIIRGQLVGPRKSYKGTVGAMTGFVLAGLLLNCKAKPDFVAYDMSARGFIAPHVQRTLFKTPMAAWTVRSKADCDKCIARGEMPIFENFEP